jgi:mitochondrial fission protein ELM1
MAENSRFSLPLTWIITEGLAGTENQCLGVAEALGVTPEIKRVSLKQPWKLLSPYLGFEKAASFAPPLCGPWPDLLIASGRKSIAASRYIKKASGGKTFTVQIQDPRISLAHFDLVAVPPT